VGQTAKQQRTIKVVIADDHDTIRRLVCEMLERNGRIEVCGEAADGAQAIQVCEITNPDVLVLNISMPVMSGLVAARELRNRMPKLAIVILSAFADNAFVQELKTIGVHNFVSKGQASGALVRAIQAALEGEECVVL
jgi:DNA-binding NarL/FixJ family response regulator